MLEIDRMAFIFKLKDIWWSLEPYDIKGYDRIRFHSCEKTIDLPGFQREELSTLIIDLNEPLETIWKKMAKTSCKYAINRALKDGIKIKINQNYDEFCEINKKFVDKKKLPFQIYTTDMLKNSGVLFVAEFNNEILGGQFYLKDNIHMRWLWGSSKRLEVNSQMATIIGNANRLIIWSAIQYGKESGLKEFDMGGYYEGERKNCEMENINKFKASFGGTIKKYYTFTKYYSHTLCLANKLLEFYQRIRR